MNISDKLYVITIPSGDRWAVPMRVIVEHRAKVYAKEFDEDLPSAIADTEAVFEDEYEIHDWALNNMNWVDVKAHAELYEKNRQPIDWQQAWINGKRDIIEPSR